MKRKESHFSKVKYLLNDKDFNLISNNKDLICFDLNNEYIQNRYASINSTFLELTVSLCNPIKRYCPDVNDPIYSEAYAFVFFINSYVNFVNYTNPINYYLDYNMQLFSKDYLKRNYVRISNNLITIDNGWIFPNSYETNFFSVNSFKNE